MARMMTLLKSKTSKTSNVPRTSTTWAMVARKELSCKRPRNLWLMLKTPLLLPSRRKTVVPRSKWVELARRRREAPLQVLPAEKVTPRRSVELLPLKTTSLVLLEGSTRTILNS